ncbi:hypothetical protein ACQ4LE_000578 [Meloidogyne hapla]|uniref:Apple domain-containing protein n=1 Tax=Meloidogyne hapla TaxID=6305 RepID=A0A1I8BIP0_MELHA
MPFQIPTCSSTYGHQTTIKTLTTFGCQTKIINKLGTTKHRNNKEMNVVLNKNLENNIEDEQNKQVLNKTNISDSEKLQTLKTTWFSSPCFATCFYSNKTLFSFQQMFLSFLLFIALFVLFLPVLEAQSNGKCYSFAPGLTILGADYRRDFGLSRRQCADVCKTDVCCMAFEWQRTGGQCTLKSRSLNGTVVNLAIKNDNEEENEEKSNNGKDLLFALCLDYGDTERDRFWDHELGGPIVANKINVERENCAKVCAEFSTIKKRKNSIDKNEEEEEEEKEDDEEEFDKFKLSDLTLFARNIRRRTKRPIHKHPHNIEKSVAAKESPAVIYNWRPVDPTDMESPLGECQCISILQHIKLNFGSFSGFLI